MDKTNYKYQMLYSFLTDGLQHLVECALVGRKRIIPYAGVAVFIYYFQEPAAFAVSVYVDLNGLAIPRHGLTER